VLLGQSEFIIGQEDETGSPRDSLTGPLWVGSTGEPLGYSGVERTIMETTPRTIGRSLSPHDFRRNGATTARFHAGNEPHLASGLLHHRDRNVTENYNSHRHSTFGYVHGICCRDGTLKGGADPGRDGVALSA
jgi:hypothetical protein